jgi:hypothetical protein
MQAAGDAAGAQIVLDLLKRLIPFGGEFGIPGGKLYGVQL